MLTARELQMIGITEKCQVATILYYADNVNDEDICPNGIDDVLNVVNAALNGFGIEAITAEHWVDSHFGNIIAVYVNTGDAYSPTIVYDTNEDEFFVTSYGDWLEQWESENQADEDESGNDEEPEPDEEDITTDDGLTFRYLGKVIVSEDNADTAREALNQWCEREGYWPNVWMLSDQGNAHLLDI